MEAPENGGVVTREDAMAEEDGNEKRGKVRIQGVGGSLTVLLQLAILAFGVRHLRNILAKRSQNRKKGGSESSPGYATISSVALKLLINLDAAPYQLLDVRSRDEAKAAPLPFEDVVNIPESELRGALQLPPAAWEHRFGTAKQPDRRLLLVILASDCLKQEQAAATAAALGYSRCCVLRGGLKALEKDALPASVKWINRDALAILLARHSLTLAAGDQNTGIQTAAPVLLDVRRHDERTFFGSIPGSRHVPVDLLPLALESDEATWQKQFRQAKVSKEATVIMQCRTNRRAQWAAQLAHDAGFEKCFVYRQGVFGWRLHSSVMPYTSYDEFDGPPEPVQFEVESVDDSSAEKELEQLGLLQA